MKVKIDNLAFCEDCTIIAVNGDYTGLDYHYSEEDAAKRKQEIDDGLDTLGWVYYDDSREPDEFSARRCDCCGSALAGRRDYFVVLGE